MALSKAEAPKKRRPLTVHARKWQHSTFLDTLVGKRVTLAFSGDEYTTGVLTAHDQYTVLLDGKHLFFKGTFQAISEVAQ